MTDPRPGTRQMVVPTGGTFAGHDRVLGVAVLGSTGSIGRQTLEVISLNPDRFKIVTLTAGNNTRLLAEQTARFRPDLIAVEDERFAADIADFPVRSGQDGLIAAATHPNVDIVVVATSGHAAIVPTARAIEAGKTIALANKESIVCAGELIIDLAVKHGVEIRPVDSEHSAIWQSLGHSSGSDVDGLILTASGGPFRETPADKLALVTVSEAMAHPTWAMGGKITVDSATLMNKGLELIEAHWLFGVDYDRIDVVVHPESIIHSLVEFVDGSQVAQLSHPDMKLPIQFALTYPRHEPSTCRRLSLAELGTLRFFPPDLLRFPALRLAREAGVAGQTYPTVLSAADEIAVTAFVAGRIRFIDIADVVARVLASHRPWSLTDFAALDEADHWGRRRAAEVIAALAQ